MERRRFCEQVRAIGWAMLAWISAACGGDDGGSASVKATQELGGNCETSSECAEGTCELVDRVNRTCTRECTEDADCAPTVQRQGGSEPEAELVCGVVFDG